MARLDLRFGQVLGRSMEPALAHGQRFLAFPPKNVTGSCCCDKRILPGGYYCSEADLGSPE